MTGKLRRKLLLICISFAVVLTLFVMSSLPTMAASPTVIPTVPPIQNMGSVTGTLTVADSTHLAIVLNTATSLATTPASGQSITIIYNKTNSDIELIMLQHFATPLITTVLPNVTSIIPPIQSMGTVTGTLTVVDSTHLAIVLNTATSLATASTSGQKVTVFYNKANSDVDSVMLQPTITPTPPTQVIGTVTGILTVKDSSDLAIVLNTATTLAISPVSGQRVTILYSKTNSDIESIMLQPVVTPLTSAGQPNITPIIPPIQNIGTVTGILTVKDSSDLAIVLNTATTLSTTPTSGQKVTVLYNKTNSDIDSITLEPLVTTIIPPVQTIGTVTGTLTVVDSTHLETLLNAATSLATTPASGQSVTVIYNKTNSDIESIMLQPISTPLITPVLPNVTSIIPPIQSMGTVTGTLTVVDSTHLAIVLNTETSLATASTSGQKVTVLYNKANSDVDSIMLQPTITPIFPPIQPTVTPVIPPLQNGSSQSGHGLLGGFTSDLHQGVNWLKTHLSF